MATQTRWFRHGELHLALLALLQRRPMHGYELMGELADAVGSDYQPSPGSIYPAVQSLAAEGLITATQDADRRVYSITAEGGRALGRRARKLAELERRIGVSFADGIDAILARFNERVKAAHPDEGLLTPVLERTAQEIESMTTGEGT